MSMPSIVRLFNPSTESTTAIVSFDNALAGAELANLNEEPLGQPLVVTDAHQVSIKLAPRKIVTIKATPVGT